MDTAEGNLISRPVEVDDSPLPERIPETGEPFWRRTKVRIAAVALAAVAVGGGVTAAVESGSSSSTTTASGAPTQAQGAAGAGGAPGGAAGGAPSQYRLSGTVTAVTSSSITVKSSTGTSTVYTTTSATRLVRNGSTVALSSFQVGDSVIGSVTASGSTVLSDLMVGTAGGAGGGAPPAA